MNFRNLAMWAVIVILTIGLYNMFKNPQGSVNKKNSENQSNFFHAKDDILNTMKNDDHIVIDENKDIKNDICEECKKEDVSVKQNLIMHSFKLCNSCKLSKTIFPI